MGNINQLILGEIYKATINRKYFSGHVLTDRALYLDIGNSHINMVRMTIFVDQDCLNMYTYPFQMTEPIRKEKVSLHDPDCITIAISKISKQLQD